MTTTQSSTPTIENIVIAERIARVILGLAALFALLHLAIATTVIYPFAFLIASAVVFSGIIGWDPLYAVIRAFSRGNLHFKLGAHTPFKHA